VKKNSSPTKKVMGTPSVKDAEVYGIGTALGGRAKQQDSAMTHLNMFTVNSKVYNIFGIFDGHGIRKLTRH
jgi:serine/threonine protein phosphatase PrpC